MLTRLFIPLFLLVAGIATATAQNAPRTVVGNAGDYYESLQFGNLHFTVGELAVSRLQNGLVLSEGFHQGYYELLVSSEDPQPPAWEVAVYPNPTATTVTVSTASTTAGRAALYDAQGRLLHDRPLQSGSAAFDLSAYPAGSYWLRLQDAAGQRRSFQVQKVVR